MAFFALIFIKTEYFFIANIVRSFDLEFAITKLMIKNFRTLSMANIGRIHLAVNLFQPSRLLLSMEWCQDQMYQQAILQVIITLILSSF